jgi:ElaB/YqjD/DUF883 family membrane-anchored ribosome-binding protein
MTNGRMERLNEALSVLNSVAEEKGDQLQSLIGDRYGQVKEILAEAGSEAAEAAARSARFAESAAARAAARARQTAQTIDNRVHESPWLTLGPAVIAAFAIGLWIGTRRD